jgi:hypothetical protein
MANVFRIAKAVVLLAIAAFIIMVVVGVYTALDAAPGYTLASSAHALDQADTGLTGQAQSFAAGVGSTDDAADGATEFAAPSAITATETEAGTVFGQSAPVSPSASTGNASGLSASPSNNAGNTNGNSSAGGTAPAAPITPAPETPTTTYHPAWDEWIESGYFETRTVPATYGERSIYGSVCSECGANISGYAMQHLKDTHHSGYHEGIVGSESYEITPAKNWQEWVDTSHWVHHDAYSD